MFLYEVQTYSNIWLHPHLTPNPNSSKLELQPRRQCLSLDNYLQAFQLGSLLHIHRNINYTMYKHLLLSDFPSFVAHSNGLQYDCVYVFGWQAVNWIIKLSYH